MKFPKNITFGGYKYKITRINKKKADKLGCDGFVDTHSKTIKIQKYGTNRDQFDTFMHELIEGVFEELGLSYYSSSIRPGDDETIFVFNHKEFQNACKEISKVLYDMISLKGKK